MQVLDPLQKFERPVFWNGWKYDIKNYCVEVTFNCMASLLNLIKIYPLVQTLLVGDTQKDRQTDRETSWWSHKPHSSLFLFGKGAKITFRELNLSLSQVTDIHDVSVVNSNLVLKCLIYKKFPEFTPFLTYLIQTFRMMAPPPSSYASCFLNIYFTPGFSECIIILRE
jgi:hypothetical protein